MRPGFWPAIRPGGMGPAAIFRRIVVIAGIGSSAFASAATYYVSPTGSDGNAGSLSAPFRTVQKGVSTAQPGDTVILRQGVYRETVTFPQSGTASAPITLEGFSGETATINGCDVVGSWSSNSNGTLAATPGWDLGVGSNQLFVDGQMMPEARWPKMGTLSRPVMSISATCVVTPSGNGSAVLLTDPTLTLPAESLLGARVNFIDNQNLAQSGIISGNLAGRLSFTTQTPIPVPIVTGSSYFVYGSPTLITAPGDWETWRGTIWFLPTFSDSATNHTIEWKHRSVGIDLSGCSYVIVQGISLVACTLLSSPSSSHLTLSNINSKFAGQKLVLANPWTDPDPGIVLSGSNNQISSSVIAYTSGTGLTVTGSNCSVTNCQVHDADYCGGNTGGISVNGSGLNVSNNTVYNTGRFGIYHYGATASVFANNEVYYFGLQTTDCGGIYTWHTDGQGTVISYNVVHDATNGGFHVSGVYLDNGCQNTVVHHNLVYNVDGGFRLNNPATNILVANNTLDASLNALQMWDGIDYTNVTLVNNIETLPNILYPGLVLNLMTNLVWPANPSFVDPTHRSYLLKAGSPAIGAGTPVAGITSGNNPDVGAFPYGAPAWTAGSSVAIAAPPAPGDVQSSPGIGRITITWNPRPGATTYNVYRSAAAGGPFTLLATNVSGPAYTDAAAPLKATSWYCVTAVNSSGESGLSGQTSSFCYPSIQLQGLIGEYFSANNAADMWIGTVFSQPLFRRLDPNINFNWGIVGPGGGLGGSQFAVIWSGLVTAPATGAYTFSLEADTGGRLYVNNQLLVDQLFGPNGTYSGTINLTAGKSYSIRIEYEKVTGWDSVNLYWAYPGQSQQVVPSSALSPYPGNGLEGSYYNDSPGSFGGFTKYVLSRLDGSFNQLWLGPPAPGVNGAWWSTHWHGQLLAPVTATYSFQVFASNGERLSINGQSLTSRWSNTIGTETASIGLQGGQLYDLQLDYANGAPFGGLTFSWSFPGQVQQTIPVQFLYPPMQSNVNGIEGQYYADPNFSTVGLDRIDQAINFDWTTNPPASNVPNIFSARWSGQVMAAVDGAHTFVVSGIGHARLIVNGSILVDNASDNPWTVTSRTITLSKGKRYDLRVEYSAGAVPGKLQLSWSYAGQNTVVIPTSNLFLNYDIQD